MFLRFPNIAHAEKIQKIEKIKAVGRIVQSPLTIKNIVILTVITHSAFMSSMASVSFAVSSSDEALFKRFLKRNCYECHRGEEAEGGLNMTKLSTDLAAPNALAHWIRIMDRVSHGEMPPKDADQPQKAEKQAFLSKSSSWIRSYEKNKYLSKGRVHARRLTNKQLERSLHHLLGIDLPLADQFPKGLGSKRFSTIADQQPMSSYHLQRHLEVVDMALDAAYDRAFRAQSMKPVHYNAKALSRSAKRTSAREPEFQNNAAVIWPTGTNFVGRMPATTAQEDGWVRITLRASAIRPPKGKGVWSSVRIGKLISTSSLMEWVGAFEAQGKPKEWTFETWLPKGYMFEIRPNDNELKRGRFTGGQVQTGAGEKQKLSGLAIHWIKIQRIYKGPDQKGVQSLLFGRLPVKKVGMRTLASASQNKARQKYNKKHQSGKPQKYRKPQPQEARYEVVTKARVKDLEQLLMAFASRAFRRPVNRSEVAPYIRLAQTALKERLPFHEVLRRGYRAILCSPRFMYFYEAPGRLDDYAIASRLSYFLWQSPPDKVLLDLAKRKKLGDKTEIEKQVERMLADHRGKRFVKDLAHEWLDLKDINFTVPDRRLYPKFDPTVQGSMVNETEHYLKYMLEKDLSVTHLIDSDFTFLNSRLARYYSLPAMSGDQMRKTKLPRQSPRGGLLGQGAILKVTANGTTTSPIIRGVWMLEKLLGEHVPPPPPNVPAVEPDIRGAKSIKDMLIKHRADASCAACHKKIDPPGFALENFDATGAWRTKYGRSKNSARVDPSYRLAGGQKFKDVKEFKNLIARKPEKLAANVVDQLLTFGTGAKIGYYDRDEVRRVVKQAASRKYGFATLLKGVVTSEIFLRK